MEWRDAALNFMVGVRDGDDSPSNVREVGIILCGFALCIAVNANSVECCYKII